MKYITIHILILIVILIQGCDNSLGPSSPKTSGETTLTTQTDGYKFIGFSFSQGGNIVAPNAKKTIPDIRVHVQTDPTGEIQGILLSSGTQLFYPAFHPLKEFDDTDAAEEYFNNVNEAPDIYADLAFSVEVNQVWAVKTNDDKYGIILILHTDAYEYTDDSNPAYPALFGEVRFKWKYQPDGSKKF
ncbi:MAG: hypothetical protein ACNA8K_10030 [Cyclonatronaceae bacterium]